MADKKQKLQQKIDKLEKISSYFNNSEELELDEAIKKYEEAAKLVGEVKKELKAIETKINEIKLNYSDVESDPDPIVEGVTDIFDTEEIFEE